MNEMRALVIAKHNFIAWQDQAAAEVANGEVFIAKKTAGGHINLQRFGEGLLRVDLRFPVIKGAYGNGGIYLPKGNYGRDSIGLLTPWVLSGTEWDIAIHNATVEARRDNDIIGRLKDIAPEWMLEHVQRRLEVCAPEHLRDAYKRLFEEEENRVV